MSKMTKRLNAIKRPCLLGERTNGMWRRRHVKRSNCARWRDRRRLATPRQPACLVLAANWQLLATTPNRVLGCQHSHQCETSSPVAFQTESLDIVSGISSTSGTQVRRSVPSIRFQMIGCLRDLGVKAWRRCWRFSLSL